MAASSPMLQMPPCSAVLLAGSAGSRMYPLNASGIPKVLLPVANRPLLTFPLRMLEESGVADVLLVCEGDVAAEAVRDWLTTEYNGSLHIEVIRVEEELPPVDALRQVMDRVRTENFVLLSGDVVSETSLRAQLLTHHVREAVMTSASQPGNQGWAPALQCLADGERMVLYAHSPGIVKQLIIPPSFLDRFQDIEIRTDLVDMQVYVFHTLILKAVLAANEKLKQLEEQLIPHIVRYQLKPRRSVGETEAATLAARHSPSGGNLMGLEGSMADMSLSSSFSSALGGGNGGVGGIKPEWYCCTYLAPAGSFCQRANTLQGYADVNRDVLSPQNAAHTLREEMNPKFDNFVASNVSMGSRVNVSPASMIGPSCELGDRSSVKRSVVGSGCVIGTGSKVVNSVLHDDVRLGPSCTVHNCILSSGVSLGEGVRLRDCQLAPGYSVPAGAEFTEEVLPGGYGGSEAGYGGVPSYPYKGSGLLDDDPKGLRKKKTLARKVASHAVKIVVVALMLIAYGGWMWAHKHKKALHAHLDTTLSTLNVAESDKSRLRRSLGEKEAQLKKKERELSDMRTRLERLTGDLGNTHSKHTEHSSKLEQNLLNCQGELLVAQNRVVELDHLIKEQEQLVASCQEKLEVETRKQVDGDGSQVQENASLRKELQDCQGKLQKSAAGNLDPGFLEEQQRLREQEAAAKAKLHAAATPENLADWRGHLPPGPAAVPVTAQQQEQTQQQQPQQQQQQQQQQQEQAKQEQVQEPPQQAVQAPGTQAPTQVKAPGDQTGGAAPGGQQPQDQKPQDQQPQATPGEETKPAGKHNHMSVTERLRDARVRRRRQRAQRAKQHTLSQLEQALGHAAAEEEESGGDSTRRLLACLRFLAAAPGGERHLSSTAAGSARAANGRLFNKLLVANRGEIAVRVMRTAKRLGIPTVAIYSEADTAAVHARYADEAVCVGPAASTASYLNIPAILAAMKQTGADAVHPGYGFLSENASFVEAVEGAGATFVGPPTYAVEKMGDKVNTIPGWAGVTENADHALSVAKDIGFPVMIKASAGGGGKGMRVAWNEKELREGYELCTQEAASAFGDSRMLIEKFIEQPRHIEIQVLGDKHGNVVYFPERECSIQRRNQKVIEEAPSPLVTPEMRRAMGEQAVALCKAVGYHSAGTVEFLANPQRQFYFLEMNTRLQVEHPITEMITGQDLVEHMLRVAAGHPLTVTQDQLLHCSGWAMECRVYAEDPARGFLPSIGRLQHYQEPRGPSVRCDSGVQEGSEISMHYDPLISKLVTHGVDRQSALAGMRRALDSYVIRGVRHNATLLRSVLDVPQFVEGDLSTAFLAQHYPTPASSAPDRLPLSSQQADELLAMAAMLWVGKQRRLSSGGDVAQVQAETQLVLTMDEQQVPVTVRPAEARMVGAAATTATTSAAATTPPGGGGQALEVQLPHRIMYVRDCGTGNAQLVRAEVDGQAAVLQVLEAGPRQYALQHCGAQRVVQVDGVLAAQLARHMPVPQVEDFSKVIRSPMPGTLVSVTVKQGQRVAPGDEVAVVEAMKMRNVLRAEVDGVVGAVEAEAGAVVAADQVILKADISALMTTLPPDLLLHIFSLLSAGDLAAMSMQDTYLRQVAADTSMWEPLSLARWPGADAERHYGGDWHSLYMARAPLPLGFPLAADRIHTITAVQQQGAVGVGPAGTRVQAASSGGGGGSFTLLPQLAFEDVMRQTFIAGLACAKDKAVRRTSEWRGLKQDLTWWATERPVVVVAFIRGTHEAIAGATQRGLSDTAWRRSAVAFLQDLGLLAGAHASVVNRIDAEAALLDRAFSSSAQCGRPAAPDGMPTAHWSMKVRKGVGPEPHGLHADRCGGLGRGGRRRPIAALLLAAALAVVWMAATTPSADTGTGRSLIAPQAPPVEATTAKPADAAARPPQTKAASSSAAAPAAPANAASNEHHPGTPHGLNGLSVPGLSSVPVRAAALARLAKRIVGGEPAVRRSTPPQTMAKPATPAAEPTGASGTSASGVSARSSGVDDDGIRGVTIPPASDDDGGECHPELIVMLTSHKTGTAQAGCIVEMLEQRHFPEGAFKHDHHPQDLHAIAKFAVERVPTNKSIGRGGTYCPSVKTYSSGHHLPRVEDEGCPGTLPCPCKGQQEQCLSLEPGTIDIPTGHTTPTVVQVSPPPEEWLEEMTMKNFSGWAYVGGVPYEALDSLGVFDKKHAGESFYHFLRTQSQDTGVKVQFWLSAWELYGFARQYASLAEQPGLNFMPVRFEDMQTKYNETTRTMLEAFSEVVPPLNVSLLLYQVRMCHVSSWSSQFLADNNHVTARRDPKLRKYLHSVLMDDEEIAPRICKLATIFGYAAEMPECAGSASRSAKAPP
ncbi:Propionyl-CoA carboxylase alpha chain [Chlorella vulgaris]